jgi:ketosteroid isomerase-like protein
LKKSCFAVLATLVWVGVGFAQSSSDRKDKESEQGIRDTLTSIEKTWNAHDVEAFMANYWHSPDLTVFGSSDVTKGWDGERANIIKDFMTPSTLVLSNMQVGLLGPGYAYARGGWQVKAANGSEHHGVFTIVFRNFGQGWKVVHDHASGGQ